MKTCDIDMAKISAGFLIVSLLIRVTNAAAHCASFTCADFTNQTLVIRQEITGSAFCKISKTTKLGEPVPCASNATAILLSPSHLLIRSPEGLHSQLFLEYGRDHEPGEHCFSHDEACQTPPPSMSSNGTPMTTPPTSSGGLLLIIGLSVGFLFVVVICIGVCIGVFDRWSIRRIRKYKYILVLKVQREAGTTLEGISTV